MPKDISVCWNIGLGVAFVSSSSRIHLYTHVLVFHIIIYTFFTLLCHVVSCLAVFLSLSFHCSSNPLNTSTTRTQTSHVPPHAGRCRAGVWLPGQWRGWQLKCGTDIWCGIRVVAKGMDAVFLI